LHCRSGAEVFRPSRGIRPHYIAGRVATKWLPVIANFGADAEPKWVISMERARPRASVQQLRAGPKREPGLYPSTFTFPAAAAARADYISVQDKIQKERGTIKRA